MQHILALPSSVMPVSSLSVLLHPFLPAIAHRMWFSGKSVCSSMLFSKHMCAPCLQSATPTSVMFESHKQSSDPQPRGKSDIPYLVFSFGIVPEDTRRDYNLFLCPQLLSFSLTHRRHSNIF